MYYELTLRYDSEDGKSVQERYIASECDLFSEAEYKGMSVREGCEVTAIRRSQIREFVNGRGDKPFIFIASIADVFTKDDGTEKELLYKVALWADDITEAQGIMREYMRQGLQDMRLKGINQTKFIDVL